METIFVLKELDGMYENNTLNNNQTTKMEGKE